MEILNVHLEEQKTIPNTEIGVWGVSTSVAEALGLLAPPQSCLPDGNTWRQSLNICPICLPPSGTYGYHHLLRCLSCYPSLYLSAPPTYVFQLASLFPLSFEMDLG